MPNIRVKIIINQVALAYGEWIVHIAGTSQTGAMLNREIKSNPYTLPLLSYTSLKVSVSQSVENSIK